jgi:integration host factor subunit beta
MADALQASNGDYTVPHPIVHFYALHRALRNGMIYLPPFADILAPLLRYRQKKVRFHMLTKSTLIDDLSDTLMHGRFPNLTKPDIRRAVDLILANIGEAIADGGHVELRGFGSFTPRDHPGRTGRNPRTGDSVVVPPKRTIHFKPSIELRERVDAFTGKERMPQARVRPTVKVAKKAVRSPHRFNMKINTA